MADKFQQLVSESQVTVAILGSAALGAVTGTVTVPGACFTGPLTLAVPSVHVGETLSLNTSPDANGTTLSVWTGNEGVSPDGSQATGVNFQIAGGPCDGETFTANLTHN